MLRNFLSRLHLVALYREPALVMSALASVLTFGATLNIHGLSAVQAALIATAVNAVGAAVVATRTRPIAPAVFTGGLSSLVSLAAAYGLHVGAGQVGALNVVVLSLLALLTRGQVSPVPQVVVDPTPVTPVVVKPAA